MSCGVPGGGDSTDEQEPFADIGDLDERARAACELYAPIAGDVRSGELTGPPLFRALQDVFNEARQSQIEDFGFLVQAVLNAAITEDQEVLDQRLDRLDEVCADA